MAGLDAVDTQLLDLLTADARASVADLARTLGLARSTVTDRIARLERTGVIQGWTIRLGAEHTGRRITAHVQIVVDPKRADAVVQTLRKIDEVKTLLTVSGPVDLIAVVSADSPASLDAALDRIGHVGGVERTTSAVVLTTKISR